MNIVKNVEEYEVMSSDPTNKFQTKCNNFTDKLRDRQLIDNMTCKNMNVYKSQPPRIYRLLKIHKCYKLRSVVPCIKASSYKISKYIVDMLSNLCPKISLQFKTFFTKSRTCSKYSVAAELHFNQS